VGNEATFASKVVGIKEAIFNFNLFIGEN